MKGIEGVESVQNNIGVLPPSPDDDRIRLAEYHAIYGFDGLYRYGLGPVPSIHIIVKNGHVTCVAWWIRKQTRKWPRSKLRVY